MHYHCLVFVATALFLIIYSKVYNLFWILVPECWEGAVCLPEFLTPFFSLRELKKPYILS